MIRIEVVKSPAPHDEQVISDGLRRHNDEYVPADGDSSFAVLLRGTEGMVVGGVLARAGRGWLRIGALWVLPALRGQGYGTRLLAAAEAEGQRRGCHSAYLDTFSFQAPAFYERCGYRVFGTLDDFPAGHQRFFMRKSLKRRARGGGPFVAQKQDMEVKDDEQNSQKPGHRTPGRLFADGGRNRRRAAADPLRG